VCLQFFSFFSHTKTPGIIIIEKFVDEVIAIVSERRKFRSHTPPTIYKTKNNTLFSMLLLNVMLIIIFFHPRVSLTTKPKSKRSVWCVRSYGKKQNIFLIVSYMIINLLLFLTSGIQQQNHRHHHFI
jgi:hypothetical protein